jgi:hypothetical protein
MHAFASDQPADLGLFWGQKNGLMRDRERGSAPDEAMDANQRWDSALGPRGTDGDNAVRGAVASAIEHGAMMLAVTTAARREASVRILRKRKHWRNQRKREGREQQDGEQASHDKSDSFSLRPQPQVAYAGLSLYLRRFCQVGRSCGLSWV